CAFRARFHGKTRLTGQRRRSLGRGNLHSRQAKREQRTAGTRFELDLAAHHGRQFGGDRQAEAAAGGEGAFSAVEAFEDVRLVLRRDTGAVVLDVKGHGPVAIAGADVDLRPGRRVDERVLQQEATYRAA